MIFLITGAPGSGKTLSVMSEVTKLSQQSGRPVYYSHIPDVTLPWHKVGDPAAWSDANKVPQPLADRDEYHRLPQGSIIVIDEAWAQFPNRPAGSMKPSYVEAFATHRHRGHDFYLLGQNAGQLDQFIRGMVGRHQHLERQFGLSSARRWSWESKVGKPDDYFSKEEATKDNFLFPKNFYSAYKSADVHVVQKRMPVWRLVGIGLMFVVVCALLYSVFGRMAHKPDADHNAPAGVDSKPGDGHPSVDPAKRTSGQVQQLTAQEYAGRFKERIVGWQYSASFYDEQVKAATFPKISGCMLIETEKYNKCSCNTQQGTTLTDIGYEQCVFYVHNGWFDFSKPDADPASGSTDAKPLALASTASVEVDPSPGAAAATAGPASAAAGAAALPHL